MTHDLAMASTHPPSASISTCSILINPKIFTLQCDISSNGKQLQITEQSKTSSQSLTLSWKALDWLSSSNSLYCDPCNFKFFIKFTDVGATFWLEKHSNKNGYFAYLVLPLGGNSFSPSFWQPIVERMLHKLHNWKCAYISKGGRHTLLRLLCLVFPSIIYPFIELLVILFLSGWIN